MRINVVGTTGSGKSTLAAQLATHLGCPYVELDALHWEADWTLPSPETFQARVAAALSGDDWVVDGNYSAVREVVWRRVEYVIWLDYPLIINLWRLLCRGLRRVLTREELWESRNRETLRGQFFSRDSLFVYAVRTYVRRRRTYHALMQVPVYAHIRWVHLRSPQATRRWLAGFLRGNGAP